MFRVEAPFPLVQSTLLLPSPRTGNTRSLAASVQTMRSMNGKLYTFIKPKRGRRAHRWDFLTARDKYLEAKEFVEKYVAQLVRTVDHQDVARVGYATLNPIDFDGAGRAGGWPGGEAYRFSIVLEERV